MSGDSTDEDGLMSHEDKAKLDGIEVAATADQTGAEIKALYEAGADTNAFTDADHTKLTVLKRVQQQTKQQRSRLLVNNLDTNAFTDADETKTDGIEAAHKLTLLLTLATQSTDELFLNRN